MISGKKIAIFGFGQEGSSALNYLLAKNEVSIIDDREARDLDSQYTQITKKHNVKIYNSNEPNLPSFDIVVRSPGVRPDHKTIKKLKVTGATVTSPTNIFFQECKGQIIGVTGTKGKGTTSTLIYELLKTQDKNIFLAGNIGTPMLEILPKVNSQSKVVLELSSFQLIDLKKSPHVSVVLMVTSEHMDWHKNQGEYIRAKSNLVRGQSKTDICIANTSYPNTIKITKSSNAQKYFISTIGETNGIYLKGDKIESKIIKSETVARLSNVRIPGRHNLENVTAAIAVAKIYNISNSNIQKTLRSFYGLPHRLEYVGTINGAKYYNDSFSTTPETTIAAISSFANPKILILGGSSKNSDFSPLIKKIESDKTIKALILIGPEGNKIGSLIRNESARAKITYGPKTMKQIVEKSIQLAKKLDVVLLSPACASFDMFKNYKDRGDQFAQEVKKYENK